MYELNHLIAEWHRWSYKIALNVQCCIPFVETSNCTCSLRVLKLTSIVDDGVSDFDESLDLISIVSIEIQGEYGHFGKIGLELLIETTSEIK